MEHTDIFEEGAPPTVRHWDCDDDAGGETTGSRLSAEQRQPQPATTTSSTISAHQHGAEYAEYITQLLEDVKRNEREIGEGQGTIKRLEEELKNKDNRLQQLLHGTAPTVSEGKAQEDREAVEFEAEMKRMKSQLDMYTQLNEERAIMLTSQKNTIEVLKSQLHFSQTSQGRASSSHASVTSGQGQQLLSPPGSPLLTGSNGLSSAESSANSSRREKLLNSLYKVCFHKCDGCREHVYPHERQWFRCNECADYDFCGACWNRKRLKHEGGKHTFTDMSSLLRDTNGFPVISNETHWCGEYTAELLTCNKCGSSTLNGDLFHCNECNGPWFDLCGKCMVTTDLWRTHLGTPDCGHTFTNVNELKGK